MSYQCFSVVIKGSDTDVDHVLGELSDVVSQYLWACSTVTVSNRYRDEARLDQMVEDEMGLDKERVPLMDQIREQRRKRQLHDEAVLEAAKIIKTAVGDRDYTTLVEIMKRIEAQA